MIQYSKKGRYSTKMFKIAKFNKVNNEKVSINFVEQKHYKRSKEKPEQFKTLAFDIEAKDKENNYFFTFALNCRPEELLKIPHNETIDFSIIIKFIIIIIPNIKNNQM